MNDAPSNPLAWVVAVKMGYGHQRTAHPLRRLAPGGRVFLADDYPDIPEGDRALWQRMRRFYEFMSNARRVPLVGGAAFSLFDVLQKILRFYPRRDMSRPDWNVRALYSMIRKGWGQDFVRRLALDGGGALPMVTSFYTPAFMAESYDYPGDIYCVICDADMARAWAPLHPASSRIRYFAPTRRVAERLHLYGVRPANVFLTGYPLPAENVGGDLAVLKGDVAQRVVNLDPKRKYLERYGALVAAKFGELPAGPSRPLTILFSIGGAGAQAEIARELLRSFKKRILDHEVRLIVSAGIKPWVHDYIEEAVRDCGLAGEASHLTAETEAANPQGAGGVQILLGGHVSEYFDLFNRALRTTDILWTKPSELVFYSALGLPIVMAPPLGAQEQANQQWLLRLGAGVVQDDPANADEWVFDLLESGWFAEAAVEGFVEGESAASQRIEAILRTGAAVPSAVD